MRELVFFRMESGRCPVEEFLDLLTGQQAQKVVWVMQLVEELDVVPARYFKKLVDTNGLWEIRVNSGGDIFRFLGFFCGPRLVVLTHGFQKKSRKTPTREIELAQARRREYLGRRL